MCGHLEQAFSEDAEVDVDDGGAILERTVISCRVHLHHSKVTDRLWWPREKQNTKYTRGVLGQQAGRHASGGVKCSQRFHEDHAAKLAGPQVHACMYYMQAQ